LATGTPVDGSALTYQSGALVWGTGGTGSGVAEVASLTALALVAADGPALVWVQSLKCLWRREPASTLSVDGITVINAVGGGCWERLVPTTSLSWLSQAAWYVSAAGNDEAAGGVGAPLATVDEVMRRLSVGSIKQDVTLNLVGTYTLTTARIAVDGGNQARTFTILGTMTTVATDTVDRYHAANHSLPAPPFLAADGFSDWTAHVYLRVRFPNNGRYKWVAQVDSDEGGGGARVNPGFVNTGDPFAIETFNAAIASLELCALDTNLSFLVKDVVLTEVVCYPSAQGATQIEGCLFGAPYGTESSVTNKYNATSVYLFGCGVNDEFVGLQLKGVVSLEQCCFMNQAQCVVSGPGTQATLTSVLFNDVVGTPGVQVTNKSKALFYDTQTFSVGLGFGLYGAEMLLQDVSGEVADAALTVAGDGSSCTWSIEPNVVRTTVGEVIVAPYAVGLSWGGSYRSGAQSDVGALSSGEATVAVPGADVRPPMVTKGAGSGTTQGTLAVVATSPTSFTVRSLDSTGATVTDDNSGFSWFIPGCSWDIRIGATNVAAAPGGMYS
jgi:hypothetical protein